MNFPLKVTALGLGVGLTLGAAQWTPSQTDLDAAVAQASRQWGATPAYPVTIKLEDAASCGVVRAEDREKAHPDGLDLSQGASTTSLVQYQTRWIPDPSEDITSTITFEGGTSAVFDKQKTSDQTAAETSYQWVIRINGACKMWSPEVLGKHVLHEYGHTLGIIQHSADEHSIMFWEVFLPGAAKKFGPQSITAADRSHIVVTTAAR